MQEDKTQDLVFNHDPSLGELFDKSFKYARRNYVRLLPIFLGAGVVNAIAFTLITEATPSLPLNYQNLPPDQLLALSGQVFNVLGYIWFSYFVSWLILYFAAGIAIWKMEYLAPEVSSAPPRKDLAGEEPKRLNILGLAATTFIVVLLVSFGIFLFLVGALFLGVILYLSLAACVLENAKSPWSAIKRSRQLVARRWGKTFALLAGWLLFAYVISNAAGIAVTVPITSADLSSLVFLIVSSFVLALLFPFIAASMLVLYHAPSGAEKEWTVRAHAPTSPYDSMKPEPMWGAPGLRPTPLPPPPEASQRICPSCGIQVGPEDAFCRQCGAQQKN